MLKAEKYKDELENLENRSLVCFIANEKLGLRCDVGYCLKCEKEAFKWLLEEYKEPNHILTEEGKNLLKQMIAPFELNEVTSVVKGDTNFYIYFGSNCTVYDNETLEEKMKLFKKMNDCKDYTLEELGLCLKNQQD